MVRGQFALAVRLAYFSGHIFLAGIPRFKHHRGTIGIKPRAASLAKTTIPVWCDCLYFLAGTVISLFNLQVGTRTAGAALVLVAFWSVRNDIT